MYSKGAHSPDKLTVSSGTIDGPVGGDVPGSEEERLKGMRPRMELFCKRRAPWIDITGSTQEHQEMPGAHL